MEQPFLRRWLRFSRLSRIGPYFRTNPNQTYRLCYARACRRTRTNVFSMPGSSGQQLKKSKQSANRHRSSDLQKRGSGFRESGPLVSAITLVVGVAGIFGFNALRGRREFIVEETRQLTFAPELELDPSLSPDGRMLAYARYTPRGSDIYVQQVSGSEAVNLTKNTPGSHRWPRWSPDGTLIAFVSTVPGAPSIRLDQPSFVIRIVPSLGGAPRKIVDSAMFGHAWSPRWKEARVYPRERDLGHAPGR